MLGEGHHEQVIVGAELVDDENPWSASVARSSASHAAAEVKQGEEIAQWIKPLQQNSYHRQRGGFGWYLIIRGVKCPNPNLRGFIVPNPILRGVIWTSFFLSSSISN
jgi:hypothetical protein